MTPLIRIDQYKEFEESFKKLKPESREALTKMANQPPKKADNAAVLAKYGAEGSARILEDLRANGFIGFATSFALGLSADSITMIRDISAGKPGYNSPVYNVGGKVVVSDHFDKEGNLAKNVAHIHGVPAARDDAILTSAHGVRKELIGTVKPKPATPPPAGPRR